MQENKEIIEKGVVPIRPKKRKRIWEYLEQNKEAILADYHSLKLKAFLKRWRISSGTWQKLKKAWGVQGKLKGTTKPAKRSSEPSVQVLTKDMSIDEKHRFIEEHKEEIIRDAKKLTRREMLKKWGFSNTTFYKLKKLYAPELIRRTEEENPDDLPVALAEHERYLILLGYQTATREFLNSRYTAIIATRK